LGRRLVREDDGQDVLEYALLTASIGLAGLAVMNAMGVTLSTAYVSWNTAIDNLWEPEEAAPKG
jgi:Flp pilus assembly pilin Flp